MKTGECVMEEGDQDHHIICNDQRTESMNSFADAHTPSESPEASSSESSTGGDWESGEFKTCEHVDWPKQRITSKSKLVINKSNTAKQSQQFKAKSSNIKIVNNNKETVKKLRWLTNMRNDPDFRETLVRSVNIQPRQSIDSLDMDYYSTICDNQLSVGSPCKSPSDLLLKNQTIRNNLKKQQKQQQHTTTATTITKTIHDSADCNVLIVAKPVESQSIGFKVVNNGIAFEKLSCDSLCSNTKNDKTTDRNEQEKPSAKATMKSSNNKQKSNEQSFKYRFFHKQSSVTATTVDNDTTDVVDDSGTVIDDQIHVTNLLDKSANLNGNAGTELNFNQKIKHDTEMPIIIAGRITSDDSNGKIAAIAIQPSTTTMCGTNSSIPRINRCSPFTFRDIRDEILSVMKQNSSKQTNSGSNNMNKF